jgi:hypothetical protein
MTAGQRVIAQPSLRGRTAAVALAVTFAIGLLAGLAVPRVHLPTLTSAATFPASQVDDPGWQLYRAGERADTLPTSQFDDRAWQLYRAGERGDQAG